MRKNIEISKEAVDKILNEFYSYFETGYAFEDFLKAYLEKMGLEEIVVTKRSGDGGIDLTALRRGLKEFNQADADKYYIQAKREKPSTCINPAKIRALRGSFPTGKGIFITTARVSEGAKNDATLLDPQRPIIVVDGKDLVISCIENEIGFIFEPRFSQTAMDKFAKRDQIESGDAGERETLTVEKMISNNDVRARILRIPRAILEKLGDNVVECTVCFNNEYVKKLKPDSRRTYFGGVTDVYKKYGLIADDGSSTPANSVWKYSDECINVVITPREDL